MSLGLARLQGTCLELATLALGRSWLNSSILTRQGASLASHGVVAAWSILSPLAAIRLLLEQLLLKLHCLLIGLLLSGDGLGHQVF